MQLSVSLQVGGSEEAGVPATVEGCCRLGCVQGSPCAPLLQRDPVDHIDALPDPLHTLNSRA